MDSPPAQPLNPGAVTSPVAMVLAWAGAGLGAGSMVAAATVAANDSLRTGADALVFSLWLALTYSVGFTLIGVVVVLFAGRARSPGVGTHVIVAWTFFLLTAALNWGLTWWQPANVVHGTALILGATLLLVAAVRLVRRGSVRLSRAALIAALIAPALLPPVITSLSLRQRSPATVAAPRVHTQSPPAPTLIIGIDGADWRVIDRLIAAGRLPVFERLVRSGVRGPLRTITPTYSPIIWTTILTGVGEAAHGVRDFSELHLPGVSSGIQRLLKGPRLAPPGVGVRELVHLATTTGAVALTPITAHARRVKSVWNIASEADLRVGVINWFATWPAEQVNGYLVSDRNRIAFRDGKASASADSDKLTYPPDLMTTLESTYAAEPPGGPPDLFPTSGPPPTPRDREYFAAVYGADQFALNAGRTLLRQEQLPFLALYVAGVDVCSHYFLKRYPELIDRYYELLDGGLGRLLALVARETTVILLSDHGWGTGKGEPFAHDHAPDGIILATGPFVSGGTRFSDAPSIFDIAPTVLALLGLPRSEEMPGRVLAEILPQSALASLPAAVASYGTYVPPPAAARGARHEAVTQDTVERLRALGYVQ